ncbi:hypothetical protein CAP35_10050 [Chitinophagaceae bacterium IBVUCB1]|nr:hypothetical protein CAP35_10050 [Chitinophagaceae bacterium IBVUCB1]
MQFDFKKFTPHLIIIGIFAALAFIFSYPQLQGKVLNQHDTMSWKAMSQEGREHFEKTGENVLWSNSMFGGMPTYTYYVPKNNNYVYYVQGAIMGIMGKPAGFLFLAMLCFYILMSCLKVDRWLGLAGSIAFAFSSYNLVIIGAGHETKMLAIAYMPAVVAGLLYIYNSDWWKGIPLLGLSLALMITSAHYQVVYYTIIIVLALVIGMLFIAIKNGTIKNFLISSVISLVVAVVALGPGLQFVMSTMEYNKTTMRGGQSELTFVKHDQDKKTGGLDKEYAFRWSNGIGETLCLMIPYLYGGSNGEPADVAPATSELVGEQAGQLMYWGPQPFLSGPVYFGAIICFLFVLGLMIVRSPHKWWIFGASLLSIIMSWGNHFPEFNYFLFDNVPMLNKFRTPSMVLVVAQVLFPLLAIWAVHDLLTSKEDKKSLVKKLFIATGITAGVCVLIAVASGMFFDFSGVTELQIPEKDRAAILPALKDDRQALASKSAFTSAVFILLAAGLLWAYLTDKIKSVQAVMIGLVALIAIDLMSVGNHYLNEESFVEESEFDGMFEPRMVDRQIKEDKDPYYRVLDVTKNTYNDAVQAYHHKVIGGYSPTKMEIYQDMIDVHMNGEFNTAVLNMLNTKYIIYNPQSPQVSINPEACGNAWFVNEVKWANTADEEIKALDAARLGDTAVYTNPFNPKQTAVVRSTFKKELDGYAFGKDSVASVTLTKYGLNELEFMSKNSQNGLAVFSDIYYPYGWKAYVDDKETPILKANYLLRAIKVPAGEHKIRFEFHPDTFYTGDRIALISCLLLFGITGFSLFRLFKGEKKEEKAG